MACKVIENIIKANTVLMALTVHTSDILQPLDKPFFISFKHYTKEALGKTVITMIRRMQMGKYTCTVRDIWNVDLDGYNQSMLTSNCISGLRKTFCSH